jgi:hypothetical protein
VADWAATVQEVGWVSAELVWVGMDDLALALSCIVSNNVEAFFLYFGQLTDANNQEIPRLRSE